jgi:hypothetical protein
MTAGVLGVLATMAVPLVWVAALLVNTALHNRRVRADHGRTVAGIRDRIALEQAESEASSASTEVLPRIEPALVDEPTVRLQPITRPRPYIRLRAPEPDLMNRVLHGLRRLPAEPSCTEWSRVEPDEERPAT